MEVLELNAVRKWVLSLFVKAISLLLTPNMLLNDVKVYGSRLLISVGYSLLVIDFAVGYWTALQAKQNACDTRMCTVYVETKPIFRKKS